MKNLTLLPGGLFTAGMARAQDSLTIRKIYGEALINYATYQGPKK